MDENIQKQIANLGPSEQMKIAEFIYESLDSSGDLLTPEQIRETRQRSLQIDDDPESLLTADEVWTAIDRAQNDAQN